MKHESVLTEALAARRADPSPLALFGGGGDGAALPGHDRRALLIERRNRLFELAQGRIVVLIIAFVAAFALIGVRMAAIPLQAEEEGVHDERGEVLVASRAEITDRKGRILATNILTNALYVQPRKLLEPERVARELAAIFPDLDAGRLARRFASGARFIWLKRRLSPVQQQAVLDIGDPGLQFAPREMRFYPNGAVAAHVLGGAGFGREGVRAAEIVGLAGIEKALDGLLSDPARRGAPVALSLDLGVQAEVERLLADAMVLYGAKGAGAVVMEAATGEILALASLPDFDPNDRASAAKAALKARPGEGPTFNRPVQGLYELGSVFKPFVAAEALEEGIATPDTMIDTKGPLKWGRFTIRDFHDYGPRLTLTDVIVKSSNIGAARLAQKIGPERQRAFLARFGLLEPLSVELPEAEGVKPLLPERWSELSAMTIAYGHGISVTQLHLAAAYAAIANGGRKVVPTLVHRQTHSPGPRVMSAGTARAVRAMLRGVVTRGTARMADVPGWPVAGKTGTADKPKPGGGYYDGKTLATFAGFFPADDPRYVIVVSLDEPSIEAAGEARRSAGWTAAPTAGAIVERIAPLLGLWPSPEGRSPAVE